MARSHGKILCSIWQDPDFRTLSAASQRIYMVIVSQAKLNLAGLLDYFPERLARLARDTSIHDIEAAMDELQDRQYVLIDPDTNELLVRSFTRNDPIQMANSKLRKGLWSAWQAIESTALAEAAVHEMPDDLFDHPEVPPRAAHIRRSGRIEPPTDSPTDPPIATPRIDSPIEGRTDSPPPPPPPPPPPATTAARPAPSTPVDNPGPQQPPPVHEILANLPDPDHALGLTEIRKLKDRYRPTQPTTPHHDEDQEPDTA